MYSIHYRKYSYPHLVIASIDRIYIIWSYTIILWNKWNDLFEELIMWWQYFLSFSFGTFNGRGEIYKKKKVFIKINRKRKKYFALGLFLLKKAYWSFLEFFLATIVIFYFFQYYFCNINNRNCTFGFACFNLGLDYLIYVLCFIKGKCPKYGLLLFSVLALLCLHGCYCHKEIE